MGHGEARTYRSSWRLRHRSPLVAWRHSGRMDVISSETILAPRVLSYYLEPGAVLALLDIHRRQVTVNPLILGRRG